MQDAGTQDLGAVQVDAQIILENWPRSYDCKVAFIGNRQACVTTNLARDLPDRFILSAAPDFAPRRCSVTWRGKRQVEVEMFG
jgi:hypothetical protein